MLREEWKKEEERNRKVLNDMAQYKKEIHEVFWLSPNVQEIHTNNETIREAKRIAKHLEKE